MKIFLHLGIALLSALPYTLQNKNDMTASTFHSLQARTLSGETFSFEELKGKRVLIVNTASQCGYTPQYEGLQKLYQAYGEDNFTIIGFPSNTFFQERGDEEKIADFCQKNYGVTFPIMEKVKVKGGGKHPVYQWLTSKDSNGVASASVSWNFNKFLIDEKGHWVAHYGSNVKPQDERIVAFAKGQ